MTYPVITILTIMFLGLLWLGVFIWIISSILRFALWPAIAFWRNLMIIIKGRR